MATEIFVESGLTETRIAVMRDGGLREFLLERPFEERAGEGPTLVGSVFLGRVQRVVPGMDAAFVEIGAGRAGFLAAREARRLVPGADAADAPLGIAACVREGEAVVVQAVKDPIGGKGARLTTDITLAGRLLVLTPRGDEVSLSRRITDQAERARLEAILRQQAERLGTGLIARTAAFGASTTDLAAEAGVLAARWAAIREAAGSATAPTRLFADLDPVRRALRDLTGADTARVALNDRAAHAAALDFAREQAPALLGRIEFVPDPALLDSEGIEQSIEIARGTRVSLASGGWITIESTEALTAIDVNSGRFAEAGALRDTSRLVNLEAAEEICRQLPLRGIGGLVVVDFIHMECPEDAEEVLEFLRQGFAQDRSPTDIHWVAQFGLAVLTRKRVRPPLQHRLTQACAVCRGSGRVSTPGTVAGTLLRRLEREARARPGCNLAVRAHPAVLTWVRTQPDLMERVSQRIGAVRWEERSDAHPEAFDIWSPETGQDRVHGLEKSAR